VQRDWKFSVPTDAMLPAAMRAHGALCGRTLARAHARSGDRIAIAGYLGSSTAFDTALGEFAAAYADQNDREYAGFQAAVRSGRLPAAPVPAGCAG
jgi:thiamine monophosphate kinase